MLEWKEIFILSLCVSFIIIYFANKKLIRWKHKRISKKAIRGEKKGEKLLVKNGYDIIEEQVSGSVEYFINGEKYESTVRADFLVVKAGKYYIAEIKTGKQANISLPSVRRQMMEYQHVFEPEAILFVNMEDETIEEVSFSFSQEKENREKVFLLIIGIICFVIYFFA